MLRSGFVALGVIAGAEAALADPSGSYTVEGTNPGGRVTYSGSVVVSRRGEAFRVAWRIQGRNLSGTAVGNDDVLAVGYIANGSAPGVAVFLRQDDGTWRGLWTFFGRTTVGTETWTPRP
ncbi:hypothetical protein QNA08_18315 [Chelatococcus sp. SYSU_G07232]|uniref:Uncharacterized protein n=1 Tax=Chelatococcus albus TaxID=3047466 RepID=A0ABT7ALB5_9HYPH|nr:hypothetical protein [Chelatococcus sp. SYSU_G07232]MDJ1160171.1 hypothetical protein [Chelatococcus sp. SYSU_G07232]